MIPSAKKVEGGGNSDITQTNSRVDIPGLVKYAAPKGVKIWIWIRYKPTSEQMETAFPLYQEWGVAGVKVDFIQRDDQQGRPRLTRANRRFNL